MKIFQSPDTTMPKNQQQRHIIELTFKQLAKSELCSVKTAVLHQYITRNAMRCNNRDDLLHLSFTVKISIFSEAYI